MNKNLNKNKSKKKINKKIIMNIFFHIRINKYTIFGTIPPYHLNEKGLNDTMLGTIRIWRNGRSWNPGGD